MSWASGKCDLLDHISGLGGWYDKNGNPVKFGDPGVGVYYSDEMQDFIEFKKATGGVIHQHRKVQVSLWNQEEVAKRCPGLEIIANTKVSPDKRCKDGERTETYYTYKYYNKEYTLKELNKKGVYMTIDIHFDTLLDLIPYYPYIVSSSANSDGKMTVYISSLPYPIEQRNDSLDRGGMLFDSWSYYQKELIDHMREVVLQYYNPGQNEIEEDIEFYHSEGDCYLGHTTNLIDPNFKVAWVTDKAHWTSPKLVDDHTIEISLEDYQHFLGSIVRVKYVKQSDKESYLW